jgi:hypothetical protein
MLNPQCSKYQSPLCLVGSLEYINTNILHNAASYTDKMKYTGNPQYHYNLVIGTHLWATIYHLSFIMTTMAGSHDEVRPTA